MKTPRGWRRLWVALALTVALGLMPAAPAAAAPGFGFDWVMGPTSLWARAWSFFGSGWTKEGSSISPDGAGIDAGSSHSCPLAHAEEGAGIDPNGGTTEEGGSISPDG